MKVKFLECWPNGGKIYDFNLITGLIQPETGKIKIAGEDATNFQFGLRTKNLKLDMSLNMAVTSVNTMTT